MRTSNVPTSSLIIVNERKRCRRRKIVIFAFLQSLSASKSLRLIYRTDRDDGERKKPPYVKPADSEVSETVNTSCLPAKLPSQAAAVLMSSVYIRITYCLRVRKSKQDYTGVVFNPLTNRTPPLGGD